MKSWEIVLHILHAAGSVNDVKGSFGIYRKIPPPLVIESAQTQKPPMSSSGLLKKH